jgi:hypothetical protein
MSQYGRLYHDLGNVRSRLEAYGIPTSNLQEARGGAERIRRRVDDLIREWERLDKEMKETPDD